MNSKKQSLILLLAALSVNSTVQAEEGMWVLNNLPTLTLKAKYNFEATPQWIDHVMKSSVRLNSGGSGSFLSSDGLLLTNHHVAADTLQKKSTAEHNYYRDGFLAKTYADEIPAADLEINVLQSITDVTAEVNAAVTKEMSSTQSALARKAAIAGIESKNADEAHNIRANVITLYNGGQFNLYIYKKYTDIRIVWAPEFAVAFFGGDYDNFNYPRYDLDVALFRAYENGQPAQIKDYLKVSANGAAENELIFISGNPGKTSRINTMASLKTLRDTMLPFKLAALRRSEILLEQYGLRGPEEARQAKGELFGTRNSRKAYLGKIQALQNPQTLALKQQDEDQLRAQVNARPDLQDSRGAWDKIAAAENAYKAFYVRHVFLESAVGFKSRLFAIARTLVRMSAESDKPNGERLEEYRDSSRKTLEQSLYSSAPIYPDFEEYKLADSLSYIAEMLGESDPLVAQILNGKSPQARAAELSRNSRLGDIAERRRIAAAGPDAILNSNDPMIQLALLVDPESRDLRKRYEDQVTEPEVEAYAQISKAIFAIKGTETYPDATFSERLTFGQVKGYESNGVQIPAFTAMGGAFEHQEKHTDQADYVLPKSWNDAQSSIDLSKHLDFVSSADIIGGNSGSPVINRDAELVGIVFDGNIESLAGDYVYDGSVNRAVSVDSNAILEALKSVYHADNLLKELGFTSSPATQSAKPSVK